MNTSLSDDWLECLADELAAGGLAIRDDFLPPALIDLLAGECRLRQAQGLLAPAAIGRGGAQAVRQTVRGDAIQWLEPGQSACTDAYLSAMDRLRLALNRSLFLGLEDYESHFAFYPAGAFYQRHLDRFRDDDRRTLSAVLYLNRDWLAEDGGALRGYPGEQVLDVVPLAGRLVLFRSAELLHEVLPARRERLSLTGWFRRRGRGVL
jgi:SM-20-related protein